MDKLRHKGVAWKLVHLFYVTAMPPIDKITHTLAGAAIAAALLPWGVIPSLVTVTCGVAMLAWLTLVS